MLYIYTFNASNTILMVPRSIEFILDSRILEECPKMGRFLCSKLHTIHHLMSINSSFTNQSINHTIVFSPPKLDIKQPYETPQLPLPRSKLPVVSVPRAWVVVMDHLIHTRLRQPRVSHHPCPPSVDHWSRDRPLCPPRSSLRQSSNHRRRPSHRPLWSHPPLLPSLEVVMV